MKTVAAILNESSKPLVIDEIEIPALGVGQVLVRVTRSGICGAQINEIDAVKGPDKFLPHLLGHEGGGVVEEVGPGVTHVKSGDHVVLHWRKGRGIHAAPAKYRWNSKTVNSGWVTTFSNYTVVSENRVTAIPSSTDPEIAALMGCAITTAMGIVNNDAKLKIGESIAIMGAGGVGLSVIQAAALSGAYPIIALDIVESKLEQARQFGATHVLLSDNSAVEEEIRSIVGLQGVDVFVETTGRVKLIEAAYRLTANQGRTVMVGVPRSTEDITIHSLPLHFGKVLTGCEGGQSDPTIDIPRYLRLVAAGKLNAVKLITHRFPLQEVNAAIDTLRSGIAGRVMLTM